MWISSVKFELNGEGVLAFEPNGEEATLTVVFLSNSTTVIFSSPQKKPIFICRGHGSFIRQYLDAFVNSFRINMLRLKPKRLGS